MKFWCDHLEITDTETIYLHKKVHGYSSIEEIEADIIGYYDFYESTRYVFFVHLFVNYSSFIHCFICDFITDINL